MPFQVVPLADLRQRVARLEKAVPSAGAMPTLAFGVPAVDAVLPGGGLALGALHEVLAGREARGGAAPAMLFAGGILARRKGPVLWATPASQAPSAPALAAIGLHPDRVIHIETRNDTEALMVLEEAARQAGLAGVVGTVRYLDLTASRRLQLAAEAAGGTGGGLAMVLRPPLEGEAMPPTAAVTRWHVAPLPSPSLPVRGLARARWHLELLRCRGGTPATWTVEACDAQGRLAVPADLADRSHRPAAKAEQADLFRRTG